MFIGDLDINLNVDAVEWLARDIFPFIHRMLPDIKIYILGSNPPDRIKALDSDYFKVVGYVSTMNFPNITRLQNLNCTFKIWCRNKRKGH